MASASTNPLIRGHSPFERRLIEHVERAKPARSLGICEKPLPGGTSLSLLERRKGRRRLPLGLNPDGTINFGTILGAIPTIDGEPINASPQPKLEFAETGTQYVLVTVTGTPYQTTLFEKIFTHYLTEIEVTLTVVDEDPGPDGLIGTDEFTFILASVTDGRISPNGSGPITGGLDDLLTGDGQAQLNLGYAVYTE